MVPYYIIPVILMFASTFKRTHWLVPGYCLVQIPCLEISVAGQPQNLRVDIYSLAKIGIILVSCSCGEMESHRRRCTQSLPPSTTSKPNVVLLGLNGLVLHIFVLAWNSCIKLVPHQLTVILGLVSTKAAFLGN